MLCLRKKGNNKSLHLIECAKYKNVRENLRKRYFDCCAILYLDVNMLLEAKQEDFKSGETAFCQS